MHFPSIYSSSSQMKKGVKGSSFDNKVDKNIPSQMFGLGIQVFKIESQFQIPGSIKSTSQARQKMQAIQNPLRKMDHIPPLPKQKNNFNITPSINRQISQKKCYLQAIAKNDLILNRKLGSKQKQISNKKSLQNKIVPIIQHHPTKLSNQKSKITNGRTRTGSKCIDPLPQPQTPSPSTKQFSITKQQWRPSLNTLRQFYTEMQQFQLNQQSKAGRRKNQQYLGNEEYFISAYVNNQQPFDKVYQLYDPFTIENCQLIDNRCRVKDHHYEDYGIQ